MGISTTDQDESFTSTKQKKKLFSLKRFNSQLKIGIAIPVVKMTSPFFIVVFAMAAFAMTSTTGKDAVKNVDLAEELEKSRQALAKSHQESTQLRQESEKLRQQLEKSQESEKLRQESVKLRQRLEKSQEETKQVIKRENQKLRAKDSKLEKEAEKLRKQNEELRRQDEELKRRVYELHQDNLEIKKSLRQRDENNTLELHNIVRNSFRQMDFTSELEKTTNKQIEKYLDEHRMCVSGMFTEGMDQSGTPVAKKRKIEFGQTFRRIPTFAAALSYVYLRTSGPYAYAQVADFHVTNSSAVVKIMGRFCGRVNVNWIACL